MVQCTHLITTEGLACWLTLCILEKIICNSTNSVQISFIETLKLIVFSWTIWWCYWQNVLMINEKNNFLTVSWLSGLLSAEIFISTGEWGGPYATPNLWKQLFSAVRASGGYPGNVCQNGSKNHLQTRPAADCARFCSLFRRYFSLFMRYISQVRRFVQPPCSYSAKVDVDDVQCVGSIWMTLWCAW